MKIATRPIFCLDTANLLNPPAMPLDELNIPYFQVLVQTKERECWVNVMLSELVEACKVHAPAEFRYVEQLNWYQANGGQLDFLMMRSMEEEGYDLERLMRPYFEMEDWESNIVHPGMDMATLKAEAMLDPENRIWDISQGIGQLMYSPTTDKVAALAIAQAYQQEVWRTYPALEDLHQQELAGFIERLVPLARHFATTYADDFEDYLEYGESDSLLVAQEKQAYSPEGIRSTILENRQRRNAKPSNPMPIEVEIVEIKFNWEDSPSNTVTVWYKANMGGGVFYHFVPFSDLMEEATMKFPGLHDRIAALQESLVAIRPKEREIVEALAKEKLDWKPLLESYVNDWVDAHEWLELHRQIAEKGNYKNFHELNLTGRTPISKVTLDGQKMTKLKDRMEDIALEIIGKFFPKAMNGGEPWMLKSIRFVVHLLTFEAINEVWKVRQLVEQQSPTPV